MNRQELNDALAATQKMGDLLRGYVQRAEPVPAHTARMIEAELAKVRSALRKESHDVQAAALSGQ